MITFYDIYHESATKAEIVSEVLNEFAKEEDLTGQIVFLPDVESSHEKAKEKLDEYDFTSNFSIVSTRYIEKGNKVARLVKITFDK